MFKLKAIALILLMAVLISGKAYCQQTNKDLQTKTASGKVVKMDVEGGVIKVKIGYMTKVFYLSSESDLYMSTHHMSSLEIQEGDPVIIQYISSSGKNRVISLVDNTTKHEY